MATKKELTKEQKIKKEIARLKRVFKDLDKNKLQTVESLIKALSATPHLWRYPLKRCKKS